MSLRSAITVGVSLVCLLDCVCMELTPLALWTLVYVAPAFVQTKKKR